MWTPSYDETSPRQVIGTTVYEDGGPNPRAEFPNMVAYVTLTPDDDRPPIKMRIAFDARDNGKGGKPLEPEESIARAVSVLERQDQKMIDMAEEMKTRTFKAGPIDLSLQSSIIEKTRTVSRTIVAALNKDSVPGYTKSQLDAAVALDATIPDLVTDLENAKAAAEQAVSVAAADVATPKGG